MPASPNPAPAPTPGPTPAERQRDDALAALAEVMALGDVRLWTWADVRGADLAFPLATANAVGRGDDASGDHANSDASSPADAAAIALDTWTPYVHPDDLVAFREGMAALATPGATVSLEARMRLTDGPYRWHLCRGRAAEVDVAAEVQGNGAGVRAAGSLLDIEERKALEHQLHASHEKLALAIRGHAVGVWDWPDMAEDYIQISEELRVFMGYAPDEIDDSMTWVFSIIHPDDLGVINAAIDAVAATGGKYLAEFRIMCPGRGYRYVQSAGVITRDAGGAGVHRLTGALSDVHDRRRGEEKLRAANQQLEEFAYLVAHDLRSPLRHIRAFADALVEEHAAALGAEARHYVDTIGKSAERMDVLVREMLDYARTATAALRREPVALAEVVAAVREELTDGGQAGHLRWDVPEALPVVRADPGQMRQLFQNLLTNAAKFTRHTPGAYVRVSALDADDEYCVTVADNGAGFSSKFSERIFAPFERAHDAKDFEGTGIGLAQVARIVHRHGGRVRAEGEEGAGARFEVRLPR